MGCCFERYVAASKLLTAAEGVLFQMPNAKWAQAIRGKYLCDWKNQRIACEAKMSVRSVPNLIKAGFEWIDSNVDLDSLVDAIPLNK